MRIGVIGLGNVGETIYKTLKSYHKEVVGYDKYKPSESFEETIQSDIVFISLPTDLNGAHLDCSIVRETLEKLEKIGYRGLVVIRSTLSMDFLKDIEKSTLRIVVMPEFLRERFRFQDFIAPKIVVIGGREEDVKLVMKGVFYWLEEKVPVYYVDYSTAVMSKLVMNAFAATKISFANEVRRICSGFGVDPKLVMKMLVSEGRASPDYTDPNKGPFEGKCLPKDLEELMNCLDKSILLKAVKEVNDVVRKEWYKDSKALRTCYIRKGAT